MVMPYGRLREKTGSVATPAILHGLIDVAGRGAIQVGEA